MENISNRLSFKYPIWVALGLLLCLAHLPLTRSTNFNYLVEVRNVSYFNLIDEDAGFPNISDIERCKEICLLNCSCGAVFFRYNNNVLDGYCYIPSTVLTIREGQIPNRSFASATFGKVQIPY